MSALVRVVVTSQLCLVKGIGGHRLSPGNTQDAFIPNR
jgi:hypothetical protein